MTTPARLGFHSIRPAVFECRPVTGRRKGKIRLSVSDAAYKTTPGVPTGSWSFVTRHSCQLHDFCEAVFSPAYNLYSDDLIIRGQV